MNLKQKKYDLMNTRKGLLDEAKAILMKDGQTEDYTAKMAEVDKLNSQIEAVDALIAQEEKSFGGGDPGPRGQPEGRRPGQRRGGDRLPEGCEGLRGGCPGRVPHPEGRGDMMQEGVNADGGYAVPEDIVTAIIDRRDSKESLLGEVRIVKVKNKSGRRTFKKRSQHTGFATVAEAAKYGKVATPQFETLSYEIEKRGGYLPVTAELYEDSDADIAMLAQEWLGDEARVTANKEILAVINAKAATDLKDLDGILKAWVGLGSAFRATSKLITNDDGLLWLGTLKDQNGRYLLTPNPAEPKQLQLCVGPYVLPVKTYDNDTVPTTGTKVPMVIGDLNEGVVYWDRRSFSVKLSDTASVGTLNAFEQDLILWRGSLRDDCTKWDEDAFINGYIDTAAVQAAG